ncbi:MAG: sugar ABC transporter permease [Anaerolineales bacterium]|nr:sugar ABC transporter permease [Anaerolineales bacterium]
MLTILSRVQRKPFSLRQREEIDFYLFIGLWLVGFVLFTGGPILASFWFSFTDWTGMTSGQFVGLQNYQTLIFEDKLFWTAVYNTFYYSFGAVTLGTAAGRCL